MKINDIPVQDEKHILILLQRLAAGAESCVILDRDESHFLQTDGKELIFKNPEGLYRSVKKDFSAGELQDLFLNYYREKTGCLSNYQWQLIPGFSDWETESEEDDSDENNQRLLKRLKKVLKN